jgi:hypothetical protein
MAEDVLTTTPTDAMAFRHEHSPVLVIGLSIAMAVETVAIHLFVRPRAPILAWVLVALSVYTIVWLVRDYRAIGARPVVLTQDALEFRLGHRWAATIPRALIDRSEAATWRNAPAQDPEHLNAARPGDPNVIIHLREPIEVKGLYGMRKRITSLAMRLENSSTFLSQL